MAPLLLPEVTTTCEGEPRRLGGAFCFGLPPGTVRAPSGTRAPNMSERITEIADSTKIQRIAR